MINKIKISFLFLVCFAYLLAPQINHGVHAVTYDLIAPSGMLTRGQEVQFIINVDTEGKTLTNAQIGMTYQTDVLQYLSTLPGDTFPTLTTETQEGGRLIFTGTNNNGFSGRGTFATVNFKLIANAPGSTEICVLFNPQNTPTPYNPQNTPTPYNPQNTPTALPRTGSVKKMTIGVGIGLSFLLISSLVIFFNKKVVPPSSSPKKHWKKNLN